MIDLNDCYFFIDCRVSEEKRCMSVMCVECHDQKYPEMGWFWPGSQKGYGPFQYVCSICGKVVH